MMAAMMFPSVAPTVALYSRMTSERSPLLPFFFAAGYLVTWGGAGVRLRNRGGRRWDRRRRALMGSRWSMGRWATLVVAAGYELTPLKDACLGKCRSPFGFLLGSWRAGWAGALQMA
jgi:predicted metal-binding membrane protein